jgi:hypothetical protein
MKYRTVIVALLFTALSAAHGASAQQADAAEPILGVTTDPPRVVVGQPVTLRIDVLAPNYMTAPPELPGFQVRNAVTRQLQSVNLSEQQNGTSYAGVRFEFAIYPQEPGSYATADQTLTIKYAAEPPATREATLALPRVQFEAFIPDAAAALDPFLAATNLTVEQSIQRSSDQLKVGDAVTRVITVKADGTPAMLLPPAAFPAVNGLAVYPAQPSLQDQTSSRSDDLSSSRVDSATYMLEQPGDYLLPAIDIGWWNVKEGKIEHAHVDAVALKVVGGSGQGAVTADTATARWRWDRLLDLIADHWLLGVAVAAALAALGWFAPRAARSVAAVYRQRRAAYLQSEAWSFRQLRAAIRRRAPRAIYFAMLDWLQRFEPVAPRHTIQSLTAAAQDPALDREISAMEQELFARDRSNDAWSPHQLLRRVSAARHSLRRQAVGSARAGLPQQLNPAEGQQVSAHGRRMPAR